MKHYDVMKNLTTGETYYLETVYDEPLWDSEGRVDDRARVTRLDREEWEERKAEAEFFAELPDLLSKG